MSECLYRFCDSGEGRKLEQFGPFLLARPCAQAVWKKALPEKVWKEADAIFLRDEDNKWIKKKEVPESWTVEASGIRFKIQPTDFGHVGIFPEQRPFWAWMREFLKQRPEPAKVLNLFAYSGGATFACAQAGAHVCHLDASKGMVSWARENLKLNELEHAKIRWIVDDVMKFLQREEKRQSRYDAVILDPPTFGRGAQGELFKIEEQIIPLLEMCVRVLSERPLFILFSCHTPGFTPQVLYNLLSQATARLGGKIDMGEMFLEEAEVMPLPSGAFARWQYA